MIKTAIKHFIYEACIEQLFNGIDRNFRKVKTLKDKLVIGKHYSRIDYGEIGEYVTDAIINDICLIDQCFYVDFDGIGHPLVKDCDNSISCSCPIDEIFNVVE